MEPSEVPTFQEAYEEALKLERFNQRITQQLEIDIYLMQLLDGTVDM